MGTCNCKLCRFIRRYRHLEHQMTPAVKKLFDDHWDYSANKITDLEMRIVQIGKRGGIV